MKRLLFLATYATCLLMLAACHGGQKPAPPTTPAIDYSQVASPAFNADSAYAFVEAQLSFGFRAPGFKGHDECGFYIANKMRRWCDTVVTQTFNATLWNGDVAHGKNIIGSFNPEKELRVLLAAHWDSRLWADHDNDASNHKKPIAGANDGASGVAVLMEAARAMSQQRPEIGVDIIFFDLEDQGVPEWADDYEQDSWCKGAQHWSNNPHKPYYHARYGILLDMVGTDQPRFTKEQFSMQYASTITNKVWDVAQAIGYGGVFENSQSAPILDDHLYVNRVRGIPMVDIVQNAPRGSFFAHWHTTGDNLEHVNRHTLEIVGNVVLKTVYSTE